MLDQHREPEVLQTLIYELDLMVQRLGHRHVPTLQHGNELLAAARIYYGPELKRLDSEQRVALRCAMKTAVTSIGRMSTHCQMRDD